MRKRLVRLVSLVLILLVTAAGVSAEKWWDPLAVERQVYTYLTEKLGLNSAAACGILANIEYESAFQVTNVGDQGTSYGLCQWHNERYSALRGYCLARGLDYKTVEGQMAYLDYELKTSFASLYGALRALENSPEGAYTAGYLWCVRYERPVDMENKGVVRGNSAKYKYWNRYNSLSMISGGDQEPEDPQTLVEEILQEEAVPAPFRSQTIDTEPTDSGYRYVAPPLERKPYPVQHPPYVPAAPSGTDSADGFAMGMLFMPMGDGRRYGPRLPEPGEPEEDAPEGTLGTQEESQV